MATILIDDEWQTRIMTREKRENIKFVLSFLARQTDAVVEGYAGRLAEHALQMEARSQPHLRLVGGKRK